MSIRQAFSPSQLSYSIQHINVRFESSTANIDYDQKLPTSIEDFATSVTLATLRANQGKSNFLHPGLPSVEILPKDVKIPEKIAEQLLNIYASLKSTMVRNLAHWIMCTPSFRVFTYKKRIALCIHGVVHREQLSSSKNPTISITDHNLHSLNELNFTRWFFGTYRGNQKSGYTIIWNEDWHNIPGIRISKEGNINLPDMCFPAFTPCWPACIDNLVHGQSLPNTNLILALGKLYYLMVEEEESPLSALIRQKGAIRPLALQAVSKIESTIESLNNQLN